MLTRCYLVQSIHPGASTKTTPFLWMLGYDPVARGDHFTQDWPPNPPKQNLGARQVATAVHPLNISGASAPSTAHNSSPLVFLFYFWFHVFSIFIICSYIYPPDPTPDAPRLDLTLALARKNPISILGGKFKKSLPRHINSANLPTQLRATYAEGLP